MAQSGNKYVQAQMAHKVVQAQMATNMYKPKYMYKPKWPSKKHNNNNMPALQWPKWQPENKINKFKPEASTEPWPSE